MEFTGSRVAFSIFGLDVYWYAIFIVSGMLIAIHISKLRARRWGIDPEEIENLALIVLPFGIIGARLYYVFFEWENYAGDLAKIIDIRSGGLAIHGGLIAAFLTGFIYCKIKKLDVLTMLDIILPSVILAQGIGRWGNFANNEAHGGPTDLPWAIIVNGEKVHPTFLYESIGDVLSFLILHFYVTKKQKYVGYSSAGYLILYGILRFFVEGLRTDSLYFMGMRIAQIMSLAFILIGILVLVLAKVKKIPVPSVEFIETDKKERDKIEVESEDNSKKLENYVGIKDEEKDLQASTTNSGDENKKKDSK